MYQNTLDELAPGMSASDANIAMEAVNDALVERGFDTETFLVSMNSYGRITVQRGEF